LRLNDQPKVGVLYNMSRDFHEANLPHLVMHNVPIHVAWTDEEKKNWCFLRLSPEVWGEYAAMRASRTPGDVISLADLPSRAAWRNDWDRSDWFFQNKSAGKRGDVDSEFHPDWDYAIVDFHLWGARPLLNRKCIRAYTERFKAAVTTTDRGTIFTFFRQNPLQLDEPPFDRVRPNPHIELYQQLRRGLDPIPIEGMSRTIIPRGSRLSSRAVLRPESPGVKFSTDWARRMAGNRCRSLRSVSPQGQPSGSQRRCSWSLTTERTLDSDHVGADFANEYAAASASEEGEVGETHPSEIPVAESRASGDHPFLGPSPLEWNQDWLSGAILVCDDEHSYWHLKTCGAVFNGFKKFEEILEVAIRMALPFAVFVKRSDVRKFTAHNVSSLNLKTLGSLYAPGYVDLPLVWTGPGGGPAVYGQYEGQVGSLLGHPEAVAFVPLGGVCQFVAEVYDESIVYRYARGPSLQVFEFDVGESRKINCTEGGVFYTTDRVSNSEICLLLGHIAGPDLGADRTLWPTPEVFECESPHMRGYLSEGSHLILSNLRRDIIERKRYKWRTYAQWREYFHVGAKGDHQPKSIPKAKDFEEGAEMIRRAFPVNWLDLDIGDIILPEKFVPRAQRD
ncbi:hypothetical protein B0H13DRAFT_1645410, partial [Mycena leptocephala]